MHIYASLKRADRPLKAIYCNYKGLIVDYVNKLSGVDTWKVKKIFHETITRHIHTRQDILLIKFASIVVLPRLTY